MASYSRQQLRPHRSPRRWLAALTALVLGSGLAVVGAAPANAVALDLTIQATGPTTQPTGSTYTYQINLSCSGTNAPTCDGSVLTIPLDTAPDMADWGFDVTGGPAGFIQGWSIVGDDLVVTLADSIAAGSSQSIVLSVTPPNLITPDGTAWSLLPSVTSDDPNMDDRTAPAPASGTATATVPLSVAKTSDRTFYAAGETITYTLRATCPASAPLGSVHAASMTVSDQLPAGLTFVSAVPAPTAIDPVTGALTWVHADPASVPVACGGVAPDAAPDSITVTATVGTVGSDAADDFAPYENVPNTVNVTASPVGGGDDTSATGTRTVVMLADGDPAVPGTHSIGKSSAGPLNRAENGSPDLRATYPGRWLPNGDNSARPASVLDAAPATYTIAPRIQYESFEYEIHDKVPCLDDLSGSGVYTQSAGVCANPAFHVLGLRIDHSGAAAGGAYAPEYLRTDGTGPHPMTFETSNGNWAGWVVPTSDLGQVSEIIVPRDASQQQRRSDNIRVYGYADASTQDGQTLQNRASIEWYLGDANTATDAQTSGPADIYILNDPQLGVAKTMTNVAGATGTQANVHLIATLFSPGMPSADLVVADLLPADTTLVTDPATITAQLARSGSPTIALTSAHLIVDVIEDFVPGRDLLRVTVPLDELPAEAGRFTLTLSQFTVTKPTQPGVYSNTARAFYDDPDLMPICAAGDYAPDDADALRGDPDTSPANCAASATFRTVTSTSGQFVLAKTVQGDYDDAPQAFPAVGHVKLDDGVADYTITWTNTGAPDLDGVVIYDVLPHVGDTGVSGAQAGESRGSEFRPTLSSVGAAPAGVTVSYSASSDACRAEVYPAQNPATCVNDWTTDPDDLGGFEHVLALRLVSTAEYATGEGIALGFQMSVPTVSKDLIAWNSVAVFAQTTAGIALLPAESPKVGITASDERFTIGKSVDADHAVPGDTLTYTVTVGNTGTSESVPTTVTDVLPDGVTFVAADQGGSYDATTRTVSWDIPAIARDDSVLLTVEVTVDAHQVDDEVINRATIVNPAGYSPPIVDEPCDDDVEWSCALTTVPPTPSALPFTGATVPLAALLGGVLAVLAGAIAMLLARARRS